MKLVIVESPNKCKTIENYLGNDYRVVASYGHIRDLATSGFGGFGVNVDKDFEPTYVIDKDKVKRVEQLQSLANKADEVILATDPDREGEAIAWHLAKVLGLSVKNTKRWEFHQISRDALEEASLNPRLIDLNLVASQETRRILDRIIGFSLSKLIYKKIKSRSAGRVQSSTLKLIYDHQLEIDDFKPEEYWNINIKVKIQDKEYSPKFIGLNSKQITIKNDADASDLLLKIPAELKVIEVKKTIKTKEPKSALNSALMQQEASTRLHFSLDKTMRVAQKLFEGVDTKNGHVSFISYHRTDGIDLNANTISSVFETIEKTYGSNYLGKVKKHKNVKFAQKAHECIHPIDLKMTPQIAREYLDYDLYLLYKLIYERTIASLMAPKKEEVLSILLQGEQLTFKQDIVHTIFNGYEAAIKDNDEEERVCGDFPEINKGDIVSLLNKEKEQKFTKGPEPYSEAKLVHLMETEGIGRPSTYASTVSTLKKSKYIEINKGKIAITERGRLTTKILNKYFPSIVDVQYTSDMEKRLDEVHEGSESRVKILKDFYGPFISLIIEAWKNMYPEEDLPTGEMCPMCGAPLVIKEGRYGEFVGCSNFPNCKYIYKSEPEEPIFTDEICPVCGKTLVIRKNRFGKEYTSCIDYKKGCSFIKKDPPKQYSEKDYVKKCPDCCGHLVKKFSKKGAFLACTNYPQCKHIEPIRRKKTK